MSCSCISAIDNSTDELGAVSDNELNIDSDDSEGDESFDLDVIVDEYDENQSSSDVTQNDHNGSVIVNLQKFPTGNPILIVFISLISILLPLGRHN